MTTKDEIRRFIELVSEKTAFDFSIYSGYQFPSQRIFCVKRGNGKYIYTTPLEKKEFGSITNNDKFELLGIFVK